MSQRLSALALTIAAAAIAAAFWVGRLSAPRALDTAPAVDRPIAIPATLPVDTLSTADEDFEALFAEITSVLQRGYWSMNLQWERRLSALSSRQYRTLLDTIVQADPNDARGELRRALYRFWGQVDPRAALIHTGKIEFVRARRDAVTNVFKGWAYANAFDLEQWIHSEPTGDHRESAIRALVAQTDEVPPQRLFALMRDIQTTGNRPTGVDTFALFGAWAEKDPLGAIETITRDIPAADQRDLIPRVLISWTSNDPQAALAWAINSEAPEASRYISTVLSRWARRDPTAAANSAIELSSRLNLANPLGAILSTWSEVDAESAMVWASALPPGESRQTALSSVFSTVSRHDPATALNLLESNPDQLQELSRSVSVNFGELAKIDPDRAFALGLKLDAGQARTQALQSIVTTIATTDPVRALQLARDPSLAAVAMSLNAQVIGRMAAIDPEGAIAVVQTLPSALDRDTSLINIVGNLVHTDLELAEVFAQAVGSIDGKNSVFAMLAAQKLRQNRDPMVAAQWVDQIADPRVRSSVAAGLVTDLFRSDRTTTLAWIQNQTDADTRNLLYRSIASSWAETDPSGMAAAIVANPYSPMSASLAQASGYQNLARISPALALQTIAQLPDGETRNHLIRSTVVTLSHFAPQQAQELIATLPAGALRDNVINNFITNAANTLHPAELTAWLQAMPAGESTAQNFRNLAFNYAMRAPAEALAWADNLPAGPTRDAAVLGLATAPKTSDQFAALANRIVTVPASADRNQSLQNLYQEWQIIDPAAARAWLESSTSDEATRALLAAPGGSGG